MYKEWSDIKKLIWLFRNALPHGATYETITGRIVSFLTQRIAPLKIEASLEPIQDLHGYENPWPGGGGDNLLPPLSTEAKNYVELTNDNGKYTLSGTASANTFFTVDLETPLPAGTYTWQLFNESAASGITCYLLLETGNTSLTCSNKNQVSVGFSVSYPIVSFRIRVDSGTVLSNFKLSPTLTKGSNELPAFKPYSNICPISGHEGAVVNRTGKNLLPNKKVQGTSNRVTIGADDEATYIFLQAGTYAILATANVSGFSYYYGDDNGSGIRITDNVITIAEAGNYKFWLYKSGGLNASDILTWQLELGNFPTDYEPYSGTSVTLTFGSTVYGGKLTVNEDGSGSVEATYAEQDLGDLSWQTRYTGENNKALSSSLPSAYYGRTDISPFIAENYGGVSGVGGVGSLTPPDDKQIGLYWYYNSLNPTPTTVYLVIGVNDTPQGKIVYKLNEPVTIALTPGQVNALLGNNTVWVDDATSVTVTFQSN